MVLLVFAGCKKQSYVADFDESPEERMTNAIALVNTTLTSAPNGWIATLPTYAGGGYGFYMSFDKNQVVTMYADVTDESSSKANTANYRVRSGLGAQLVFDTYSYLSILTDPNPDTYGGVTGAGYGSDSEFTYQRSTTDSIFFVGKTFRQVLALAKATEAQKNAYLAGNFKTAIESLKTFFVDNKNPYIELTSGSTTNQVMLTLNSSNALVTGKQVDLTGLEADGKTVTSAKTKFAFTINGADFLDGGVVYKGITFVKMIWKDSSTLALYDSTGKEYIVKNAAVPLIPLYKLWGSKYNALYSEYKTIYPGTSASGAVILNYYHNGLISSVVGYNFNYGNISLVWDTINKRLIIDGFCSQNGGASGWSTTSNYNYTVDDNGVFKFTQNAAPSGGYVVNALSRLYPFILNNHIKFDYYIDGGNIYGKMTSVEDPSIVMTFVLQ